jgi:hypothetical protein
MTKTTPNKKNKQKALQHLSTTLWWTKRPWGLSKSILTHSHTTAKVTSPWRCLPERSCIVLWNFEGAKKKRGKASRDHGLWSCRSVDVSVCMKGCAVSWMEKEKCERRVQWQVFLFMPRRNVVILSGLAPDGHLDILLVCLSFHDTGR